MAAEAELRTEMCPSSGNSRSSAEWQRRASHSLSRPGEGVDPPYPGRSYDTQRMPSRTAAGKSGLGGAPACHVARKRLGDGRRHPRPCRTCAGSTVAQLQVELAHHRPSLATFAIGATSMTARPSAMPARTAWYLCSVTLISLWGKVRHISRWCCDASSEGVRRISRRPNGIPQPT